MLQKYAGIAQLIERCLAKAEVAGLSPVSRSIWRHSQVAKARVCKTLIPGSNPGVASNDVSVRTNRTDKYENQSVKWLIFSFAKNHPKSKKEGWCWK